MQNLNGHQSASELHIYLKEADLMTKRVAAKVTLYVLFGLMYLSYSVGAGNFPASRDDFNSYCHSSAASFSSTFSILNITAKPLILKYIRSGCFTPDMTSHPGINLHRVNIKTRTKSISPVSVIKVFAKDSGKIRNHKILEQAHCPG